ncbi:hypothetical protein H696_02840 [Fonticula alba]|uniref:N-acyl-aliphatic-L-amino acid amidohydrolase n=1 Tax=Fonticula alba TaxID=691883 RepID=A0A058Z893_FONAL|nr:hypothetical protein H696_02840 [Fonticula alba]KCV70499.1 hypothetical protein H696_02840 [Fonticula alba]|eukprot:XP_009495015.1 hypothetical protein H696_02840 [Fonticula alba]
MSVTTSDADFQADPRIANLAAFLAIRTVSGEGPAGSYAEAVAFLSGICAELGLTTSVSEPVANKPILIARWPGTDPNLRAILLNSHYDVVPAFPEKWTETGGDPFRPLIKEGRLYGRGAQDMKSVCIQYLEAIRAIQRARKSQVSPFPRDVVLTFVPDEEVGGAEGMGAFMQTPDFRALRLAMALDEGLASETNSFDVFYGERAVWWLTVRARDGPTGHGSRFVNNTATERLINFINNAFAFRAQQEEKFHAGGCKHSVAAALGDVLTLNLTMLKSGVPGPAPMGGYALNVIPMEAEAGFDVRIPPAIPMAEVEALLQRWTEMERYAERADSPTFEFNFHVKTPEHYVSQASEDNVWWRTLRQSVEVDHGVPLAPAVFPAATDGRYLRSLGLDVFGFSPIRNTPVRLHDHNEFVFCQGFLEGVACYEGVIAALAPVPANERDTHQDNAPSTA